MKVKELIKELEKYDKELEVKVEDVESYHSFPIYFISLNKDIDGITVHIIT